VVQSSFGLLNAAISTSGLATPQTSSGELAGINTVADQDFGVLAAFLVSDFWIVHQ
jgi:hypothetical protein